MPDPVAIRAKNNPVLDRVDTAPRFVVAMVSITTSLVPSANFTPVPIVLDYGLRPGVSSLVAARPFLDRITLATVPRARNFQAALCGFGTQAPTRFCSSACSEAVAVDQAPPAAITQTDPPYMPVRSPLVAFRLD